MQIPIFPHLLKGAGRLLPPVCLAFTLMPSCLPTQNVETEAGYFKDKKQILTARWNQPFSQEETESRHAPEGVS